MRMTRPLSKTGTEGPGGAILVVQACRATLEQQHLMVFISASYKVVPNPVQLNLYAHLPCTQPRVLLAVTHVLA